LAPTFATVDGIQAAMLILQAFPACIEVAAGWEM
jgi:hypothetical protein